jgi:murein DD-endopeptidase MepM/ murein hydrolase activator NlpD
MLFVDTTNVFDFGTRAPTRPPVRVPPVNNTPSVYRRSAQVLQAEDELRSRNLILPLSDFPVDQLNDSFNNLRAGGARRHGAVDMAAPTGTPVLSVDSGSVAKLHTSRDGGISVYATDPRGHFIYLYAHLDSYHPMLSEGQFLLPGDTLGYVGTTGNASPAQPHLHFSIRRASDLSRWSRGTPINPVRVWR